MTCKWCHGFTPRNRKDGFCSDTCKEWWDKSYPTKDDAAEIVRRFEASTITLHKAHREWLTREISIAIERLTGLFDKWHTIAAEQRIEIERLRELFRIDGEQHATRIKEIQHEQDARLAVYKNEIERLKATPVSEDELNFIKTFWRAAPSCMDKKCNDRCNPLTSHCGVTDEIEDEPRHNPDAFHIDGW